MAQIISNQATLAYSTNGTTERKTATSNVANTTLLDAYSLEVSKQSLQQEFMPGENITFTIRVTNTGYKSLNNFSIVDSVTAPEDGSAYLVYMPYTARLSIGGDFISLTPTSTSPLTFQVPNALGFGESYTLTYVATILSTLPSSVLEITNTATVTAKSVTEPEGATYSASNEATIRRNSEAILNISKSVSKTTIFNNDSYQYVLSITNMGLEDATNVVITDNLPLGFTVSSIRVENEDFVHDYDSSEYTIADDNALTIPNNTGTAINIRAFNPEKTSATIMTISGNFSNPS